VDRGESKGYVIQDDQVWFRNHIPEHLVIVLIEGDILFHGARARSGQGLLIVEASGTHSNTLHSVGLLWTSDQPDAETATYTTHKHSQKTFMPPAEFEPVIPGSKRPQTHTLDRAAIEIGTVDGDANMNNGGGRKQMYPSTGLRATCFSRARKRIWFWSLWVTVDENWHLLTRILGWIGASTLFDNTNSHTA
jgi:hypothetical protein